MTRSFAAVILAAGQGTRMKSALPKVLHRVCGLPMVAHVVDAARSAGASRVVVVVGHGREQVEKDLSQRFGGAVEIAIQSEQRGTGHAVQCALPALDGFEGEVVVLAGDAPLLPAEAISMLAKARGTHALAMLTSTLPDATGYGRVLRDAAGNATGVREHKDASETERAIREWNTGVYSIDLGFLRRALPLLSTANAQNEIYLTDLVSVAAAEGGAATLAWAAEDVGGVNDRAQLAELERVMRRRIATRLAQSGVTVRCLETAYIDATVTVAPDATIEPNVHLRGKTIVERGARIDTGSVLTDVTVRANAVLKPYTIGEKSVIGEAAQIGPFSHLRPDTELGPDTHIGNFVETKKTKMGRGSKANHLAYLGDGIIGEKVNVGAGTIFCNYDGYQKHTTTLEDDVFIGSDSQLVAPVTVGKGANVGAGSTITRNVPADALAISRAKQENKEGYASRLRSRMQSAKDAAAAEKKKGA
jgi:bifunctional UDP-N-acetylglucosamine pyrophosphorylase / glucosamine-1-phosphate N-acetyltransferase